MKKLLLLLALTSCTDVRKQVLPTADEAANKVYYTKDDRTGLCFVDNVIASSPFDTDVLTYVPCTPEVEKLIEQSRKATAIK
jgi:hypothetical protein